MEKGTVNLDDIAYISYASDACLLQPYTNGVVSAEEAEESIDIAVEETKQKAIDSYCMWQCGIVNKDCHYKGYNNGSECEEFKIFKELLNQE